MKNKRFVALAIAASAVFASSASAAILYGTTGQGGNDSTLYTVDTTTGTTTLIGGVGYNITGMDYYNGVLYGVTSRNDDVHRGLVKINTSTGAGTVIGTGWGGSVVGETITGMAIDSNGNAYGWQEPGTDDLRMIDLTTGLATTAPGNSGLDTYTLGLAFDLSDTLYLINGQPGDTYIINTGDGSAAYQGTIGPDFAHHGDVDPMTGLYWGLSEEAYQPTASLVSINLGTLATVNGPISLDVDLHTLAFESSVAKVPLPASLPFLMAGLAGLGVMSRRRKS